MAIHKKFECDFCHTDFDEDEAGENLRHVEAVRYRPSKEECEYSRPREEEERFICDKCVKKLKASRKYEALNLLTGKWFPIEEVYAISLDHIEPAYL